MLTGTLVNGRRGNCLCSACTLAGSKIPRRICDTVIKGLGLCITYIGISGALKGENTLVAIVSVAVGASNRREYRYRQIPESLRLLFTVKNRRKAE